MVNSRLREKIDMSIMEKVQEEKVQVYELIKEDALLDNKSFVENYEAKIGGE